MTSKLYLFLLLFSLLFSEAIFAETEVEYTLGTSTSKTDNISQTSNGESGTVWESSLGFLFESTDLKDWDIRTESVMSLVKYSIGTLEDEDRVNFAFSSRYEPSGTNFYFNVLENLSQVPANRFATQGVNNQRDSNVFAVSPNYFFRLSPVTRLDLQYQYADYEIESDVVNSQLQDNDRVERQATVSLSKQINRANQLAFVIQSKNVDFEENADNLGTDFDKDDFLVRWSASNATTSLSIAAGRFEVEDVEGNISDDNQFRVFFRRRLNREQSLNLQANQGVAEMFMVDNTTGTISISQQNNAISRAQLSKGFGLQYRYSTSNVTTTLGYFKNELTGLFDNGRELRRTNNFRFTYSLSKFMKTPLPRFLTIGSSNTKNEFDVALTDIVESNIISNELSYTHYTSRDWFYVISYQDRIANRTNLSAEVTDQDSRAIVFGITYQISSKL